MKTMLRCLSRLISVTALCATLLTWIPVHADNTGDYIHNATGRLRIGYVYNGETQLIIDKGTAVKDALDTAWTVIREDANNKMIAAIREYVSGAVDVSASLAGADMSELRVLRSSGDVLGLKYVLHENKAWITVRTPWPFPNVRFVINFDAEVVVSLRTAHEGPLLQIADAAVYVRNAKIDGDGLAGDIVKPLIDTFVQNIQDIEAMINSSVVPVGDTFGAQLAPLTHYLGLAPDVLPNLVVEVSPVGGTISLCFTADPSIRCAFPALSEGDAVRPVMDSSIDRCSRPVVWLWDVEKARYIGIRKGDQNVEVEVNWEFPWYCGWENNYGDEERAAGPNEMNAVRASREPDGRRIDWQFLYWKADRPASGDLIVDEHVLSPEPPPTQHHLYLPMVGAWDR